MHVHDIEPQHYNRIVQVRFAGHGFPTVDPDNPMGVMVVFTDAATHEDLEVVIDRPTALALREELDTALSVNDQSTNQGDNTMTTTKIQVTEDKVIELLLQITSPTDEYGPEHRGDGQVRGLGLTCQYVYDDNTRCIVGEVMHRLGVSDDRLLEDNNADASELLERLRLDEIIEYSKPAASLLSRVQSRQDTGYPWGDAVRLATKRWWEREQ